MTRTLMQPGNIESSIRALIAFFVIGITLYLSWRLEGIAEQWEAIFIMVVGFYFAERPATERLAVTSRESPDEGTYLRSRGVALIELRTQFGLALLLIISTVLLFTLRLNGSLQNEIAGAWIAGVALAVAFFFKPTGTGLEDASNLGFLRGMLAIIVVVATLLMVFFRMGSGIERLPVQWVALAFVVIAFYFKQDSVIQS